MAIENIVASEEIKREVLSWKKEQMTISFITKTFSTTATRENGKMIKKDSRLNTKMKLFLKAGEYINKTDVNTTLGIFLFNKLLIEGDISSIIPGGYVNKEITRSVFDDDIVKHIQSALLTKKINLEPSVLEFLKAVENYGLKLVSVFAPSYSMRLILPDKDVAIHKAELMKDANHKDVLTMAKKEKILVDHARSKLKNDPGMYMYDSGAAKAFGNNYKNMSLTIGPVFNPMTNEYDFVENNFIDGFEKKDLVAAGNIVVTSEYPKAVNTRKSGYDVKKFYSVFQSIMLAPAETDCKTKVTLDFILTKNLVNGFIDQYIVENNKYVLLTNENADNYINKPIRMRSPMFCISDQICNICAGERYYKIEVPAMGLTSPNLANNMLNAAMKVRHDMSIKLDEVDLDHLLL